MNDFLEFSMKKEGHPQYQEALFIDSTSGMKFVCGTTVKSKQTEVYEGKEMPVVVVSISSASHPLFVGGKQFVDAEGRVDRFKKRYQAAAKAAPKEPKKAVKIKKG
jgi:large subunit ribosomal protein L31